MPRDNRWTAEAKQHWIDREARRELERNRRLRQRLAERALQRQAWRNRTYGRWQFWRYPSSRTLFGRNRYIAEAPNRHRQALIRQANRDLMSHRSRMTREQWINIINQLTRWQQSLR